MSYRIVIPARFASERLPEKPLADLHGRPMIVWVAEAASRTTARQVVIATDDQRIADAAETWGHQAIMTRADHPSGSDRVMEVVEIEGWPNDEIVLNVQGDEPLIPPEVLDQLAGLLSAEPELASATLCEPLRRYADVLDPNLVKVVRNAENRAMYFSRAPIPYARDRFTGPPDELPASGAWWRHIGVYGYRAWALRRFVELPRSSLEAIEKLEQLRLLENGMQMRVEEACQHVPGGVDTEQDLARIRALLD